MRIKKNMVKWVLATVAVIVVAGVLFAQETESVALQIDQLICSYFKVTGKKPSDDDIKAYIQTTRPDDWAKAINNEFEMRKLIPSGTAEFTDAIEKIDIDTVYSALMKSEFGNYDFNKEGFKIEVGNNMSFNTRIGNITTVVLNNADFNFLAMNPDDGNAFLESRRTPAGYIDREVRLSVRFKFAQQNEKAFQDLIKGRSGIYLNAKIQGVSVYYIGNMWTGDMHYVGELIKK